MWNIGTDLGKSPHEPTLLQGHRPFGNVNLKLKNQNVDYGIGRIAPFSKYGSSGISSGIKYNKLSYGVPLKKVAGWLTEGIRLHAGYYTQKSWVPLPFKIKKTFI